MEIKKKQVLVFGYGLPVILVFIAVRLWFKHGDALIPSVLVAGAVVVLGIMISGWERIIPFYKIWMKGVRVIGMVVSTILLSIVFFLCFGIPGIILRLLRKDLLNREMDSEQTSYWIRKPIVPFDKARYKQQF